MRKITYIAILMIALTTSALAGIGFVDVGNPATSIMTSQIVSVSPLKVNDKGNQFWFLVRTINGDEYTSDCWNNWEDAWQARQDLIETVTKIGNMSTPTSVVPRT